MERDNCLPKKKRAMERNGSPEVPICPAWITEEMIEETQRVWGPYYDKPITRDEAIDMMVTIARLGEVLLKADRRDESQRREGQRFDI